MSTVEHNVPLEESDDPELQELVDLPRHFTATRDLMTPAAVEYIAKRPQWLDPEAVPREWDATVCPASRAVIAVC